MKLGFVSAILSELSPTEVVAFAEREGYAAVEAACWPKGKADRRYAGVAHVEKSERVGKPIVARAEAQGVRIGIENCSMFFTRDEWPNGANIAHSPAAWRRMFEIIPSRSFRLNYDPSHLLWQQMDYVAPLYESRERIFHVHPKDAKILRDVGMLATPFEHHTPKLPGLGEVSWGAFFSALTDIRCSGPVCVEVEDRSFEGSLDAKKAALRQSRNYLMQFLPD